MEPIETVTIGIPTFNRPDGLRRTLECMLGQTYREIEVIISDNCSSDPAVERTAREFSNLDKRVRYIRQTENIGPVHNFLYLLDEAKGNYFMWAADDDWWDTSFIETTVALLDRTPAAVVALSDFTPILEVSNPTLMLPNYYQHIHELANPNPFIRMRRYILQKEVYGKAHIIYGLMRTTAIRKAVDCLKRIVEPRLSIRSFIQMDVVLNGILLSLGNLATTDLHLRKFSYGPRKGPPRADRTMLQRLLKYDRSTRDYFDCFYPIIEAMPLNDRQKMILRWAVCLRKINFIMERIGRRLFVYKIYWHFKKRICFKPVAA